MSKRERSRKKGLLIVLSAPSGAGKTTIAERLVKEDARLWRSVSATTRRPRTGEKAGQDYLFLSPRTFRSWIRRGAFLEWARVLGRYYGTPKRTVDEKQREGRDVILVIDVKGAKKVMRRRRVRSIFLKPPSMAELARRLRGRRTDSIEEQQSRLALARSEMTQAKYYDAVVVNRDVGRTLEAIKKHIERARKHSVVPAAKAGIQCN